MEVKALLPRQAIHETRSGFAWFPWTKGAAAKRRVDLAERNSHSTWLNI
jgi:hypothetical protein